MWQEVGVVKTGLVKTGIQINQSVLRARDLVSWKISNLAIFCQQYSSFSKSRQRRQFYRFSV